MTGCGPTFLGIGAPKTGTTWLYAQLRRHPQIWLPPAKELHYFDRSEDYVSPGGLSIPSPWRRAVAGGRWGARRTAANIGRLGKAILRGDTESAAWLAELTVARYDDEWYASIFDRRRAVAPHRGEITPAYAMLRDADVARMRAMNPALRLIFIIRDPVEREWSSMRYNVGRGRLDIDLDDIDHVLARLEHEAAAAQAGDPSRADYRATIETYLRHFPREQFLVCFYDAVATRPDAVMAAVCDFLGAPPPPAAPGGAPVNASTPRPMPPEARAALRARHDAMMTWLAETLGGYAAAWLDSAPAPVDAPAALRLDRTPAGD